MNICTPNGMHAPVAIDASNAGCHVITEKPMAMNPEECQRMIDAAAKANKKLVTGFQYRFHPNTQFIKRAADEGQFGNIMFMKCRAPAPPRHSQLGRLWPKGSARRRPDDR